MATDSACGDALKLYPNCNFRGIAYLPQLCEHALKGRAVRRASGALVRAALPPILVETTTILHSFRFLARVFGVGSLLITFLVLGSLLHGELARAWVAEVRRIVKRDQS